MLERLAKANADKVRIVKVDVSVHGQWAHEQKVRGIPTFQIYSGGNKVDQFAGAYPESHLQSKIESFSATMVSSGGGGDESGEGGAAPQPKIQPMSKDWLPPGVTPN